MAKIDYEFDQGDGKPDKTGMRLRLAGIFIVVAALTCAIIYFLIPKSDEAPAETPVESPAEPQAEQTPEEPAPEVVVSDHEPVAEEADFAE